MPDDSARLSVTEAGPGRYELAGEIDAHTAPSIPDAVGEIPASGLEIEMSGVTFMDSSGLRVLVELNT